MKQRMSRLSALVAAHHFSFGLAVLVMAFVGAASSLIAANAQTIGASDSHVVTLRVDGEQRQLPTRSATVADLLDNADIEVRPGDTVRPSGETSIAEGMVIEVLRGRPITVLEPGRPRYTVVSAEPDVAQALRTNGYELFEEDIIVANAPGNELDNGVIGVSVTIDRATPLTIVLYGTAIRVRTQAATVGEVLDQAGIVPAPDDVIEPNRGTPVTPQQLIAVVRVGSQVVTVEEAVPFTTEERQDPQLPRGTVNVMQAGVPGRKVITYEVQTRNGQEVSRRALQEVVLAAPTPAIKVVGTQALFASYNADGIPARVFCDSPKQRTWKNIVVGNAAAGRSMAAERGWTGGEWDALLELFACESSWNERAGNPYSGAYGIPQSWPAEKMASAGADYMTNPITQLRWGLNYIAARYGTPSAALQFHYRTNYY